MKGLQVYQMSSCHLYIPVSLLKVKVILMPCVPIHYH